METSVRMAKPELLSSVHHLSKKIDKLMEQHRINQNKINQLLEENLEMRQQHETDVQLLEKANKEIEFLSVSHRLADSPEALVSARNKVAKLIRTIDNCIRMINED